MAITTTGSFLNANSTTVSTIAVTVANVGDIVVMFAATASATITPTGMSGTNSMGAFSTTGPIASGAFAGSGALFWAKAGATGSSTLTATYSAAIGSTQREFDGWMFTAGLGAATVWTVDAQGTTSNASSTTMTYPSLVASGTGELYAGCALPQAQGLDGATSGFLYNHDTAFTNVFAYRLNSSGTSNPTAGQTPAGAAVAAAVLLSAGLPSNPPFISQYSGRW